MTGTLARGAVLGGLLALVIGRATAFLSRPPSLLRPASRPITAAPSRHGVVVMVSTERDGLWPFR